MRNRLRVALLITGLGVGSVVWAQDVPQTQTPPVVQVPGTVPGPAKESTPAVVTTTIPSPASPTHVPEQVMWALAMSYAMEWLKKQKWFPILTPTTAANMQAFFGFLLATATAAGIHIAVTGSVLDGSGLSFSITGLTMDAIKDVGFQWVSQQGWYDALVKSRQPAMLPPGGTA